MISLRNNNLILKPSVLIGQGQEIIGMYYATLTMAPDLNFILYKINIGSEFKFSIIWILFSQNRPNFKHWFEPAGNLIQGKAKLPLKNWKNLFGDQMMAL